MARAVYEHTSENLRLELGTPKGGRECVERRSGAAHASGHETEARNGRHNNSYRRSFVPALALAVRLGANFSPLGGRLYRIGGDQ
jgi:hypothetical protein